MEFKLSELLKILNLDEQATHKLLNKVGLDLEEKLNDPNSTLTREEVAAMATDLGDTREGQLISELLKRPPSVGA